MEIQGFPYSFYFIRNFIEIPYKVKTLREDAHKREMKMLLTQPRLARAYRKRYALLRGDH